MGGLKQLTMSNLAPLTEAEIREFAGEWYRKLDVHAPLSDLTPLIVEEGFELVVPEGKYTNLDGFQSWYERAIRIFFDEEHEVKEVKLDMVSDSQITVKVIVRWKARVWRPPSATSETIEMDAYQTWVVVRSPVTQKAAILSYAVDSAEYAPGSVTLDSAPSLQYIW